MESRIPVAFKYEAIVYFFFTRDVIPTNETCYKKIDLLKEVNNFILYLLLMYLPCSPHAEIATHLFIMPFIR